LDAALGDIAGTGPAGSRAGAKRRHPVDLDPRCARTPAIVDALRRSEQLADVHRGVELDPGIAAASPDHTAGDRLAGLQLDRYTLARHELAVDMGHHPASGDVADQTELAAAIDDDC